MPQREKSGRQGAGRLIPKSPINRPIPSIDPQSSSGKVKTPLSYFTKNLREITHNVLPICRSIHRTPRARFRQLGPG